MNAAKRKPESVPSGATAGVWQRPFRRGFTVLLLLAGLTGGAYYGWQRVGPQVTQGPEYVLELEQIVITPPPPWIRADVRAETVRDGGLSDLSLLDRELTVKIARAFSLNTWVEDVRRVRKEQANPARVVVELVYRKPVAMVEVTMNDRPGLLPVDVHGVLLPPGDFSAEQARDYLRVSLPNATPAGPVGTPWGDPRVVGAARVAAALQEHWKSLGLYRVTVQPTEPPRTNPDETVFVLTTRRGAQVLWGVAPQVDNVTDVKKALSKVERLVAYVEQHGPLDGLNAGAQIDLTHVAIPGQRNASVPNRDGD
jgi:hypothetical protein